MAVPLSAGRPSGPASICVSLHRIPIRSSRASASSAGGAGAWSPAADGALWTPRRMIRSQRPGATAATDMRFTVRVPVLSKQTTRTEASVSTASSRRTSTSRRRIFSTPNAKVVVAMTGSPSGTAETASRMAERTIRSAAKPRRTPMPKTKPQTPSENQTSWRPIVSSWRCIGVSGVAASLSSRWIRPTSVRAPVATAIAVPLPPVTTVPR